MCDDENNRKNLKKASKIFLDYVEKFLNVKVLYYSLRFKEKCSMEEIFVESIENSVKDF